MNPIKLRKSKLTVDEIKTLYVVGLLTMEDIGAKAGISKQAVRLILERIGVCYKGGTIEKVCAYCGGTFQAKRYEIKTGKAIYCSIPCNHSHRSLGGDMKVSSRLGRAAWLSAGRSIAKGQVIHHIDGDRSNNGLDNLRLFDSQKEHMQYHHSLRYE